MPVGCTDSRWSQSRSSRKRFGDGQDAVSGRAARDARGAGGDSFHRGAGSCRAGRLDNPRWDHRDGTARASRGAAPQLDSDRCLPQRWAPVPGALLRAALRPATRRRLDGALRSPAGRQLYRAGALVFGGGHVVLPMLQSEVVPRGWVRASRQSAGSVRDNCCRTTAGAASSRGEIWAALPAL